MCAIIALQKASLGKRVWWIGPTYDVSMIGFREAKSIAERSANPIIREGAPKSIEYTDSGGSITFKSADSESLRGDSLDFVVFDEADFMPESVWTDEIRPALADRKGSAIFCSTPRIENGWFHRLYNEGLSGKNPEIKSWHFTSYDNPYLDPKEIDAARENLSAIAFRREMLSEFVSASGARIKKEWLQYFDDNPSDLEISMGVDLAISTKSTADYTAIAVLGRDSEGMIHVLDAQRDRLSFSEQQKFITRLAEKWHPSVIAVESVAYQAVMVQELSQHTLLNVRGISVSKDKVTRFAPIESRFENRKIWLSRDLPAAYIDEICSFPLSRWDDQVDATSLAFSALGQASAISTWIPPEVQPDFGSSDCMAYDGPYDSIEEASFDDTALWRIK